MYGVYDTVFDMVSGLTVQMISDTFFFGYLHISSRLKLVLPGRAGLAIPELRGARRQWSLEIRPALRSLGLKPKWHHVLFDV